MFYTTKFLKKSYISRNSEQLSDTENSWDQESKNKEVTKELHEGPTKFQVTVARRILHRTLQVSTTQLEEELI